MKKSVDSTFLHYGVRQEDMQVIIKACQDSDIDAEWMKQSILKPYHEERNNQNYVDDKKINRILKKALKEIL